MEKWGECFVREMPSLNTEKRLREMRHVWKEVCVIRAVLWIQASAEQSSCEMLQANGNSAFHTLEGVLIGFLRYKYYTTVL
jgi:hypothetical protein